MLRRSVALWVTKEQFSNGVTIISLYLNPPPKARKREKATDQLRVCSDDFENTLPREGLVAEPVLHSVQDVGVDGVFFIKDILSREKVGSSQYRKRRQVVRREREYLP